jgi:hypothetical protein
MAQGFFRQLALGDVGQYHDGAKALLARHYGVRSNQKPGLSVLLLGHVARRFRHRSIFRKDEF